MKAAQALDGELQRLEELADSVEKIRLHSRKSLEKAAEHLQEVADVDERLNEQVKALSEALGRARERQRKNIERIQAVAQNLQVRTEIFRGLMEEYARLGGDAAELNVEMQSFAQTKDQKSPEQLLSDFGAMKDKIAQAIAGAEKLAATAEAQDFSELNRQGDSLRQQLLGVLNRMSLLIKASAPAGPPN